jgi:hypothetical protein
LFRDKSSERYDPQRRSQVAAQAISDVPVHKCCVTGMACQWPQEIWANFTSAPA